MLRVRAIILKDSGQILLGKNQDNLYVLPGGGIKEGEHPVDAIIREVKEETSYDAFESLEYLWFLHDNYVFLYIPKNKIKQPTNTYDPCQEFKGLEWFNLDALPQLDDYTEDFIYRFLRVNILEKEERHEVDAGHIDVLVDGKKVYELEDDTIWLTLPRLAQERAKGRKVEFKQILDDGTVIDQTPHAMPIHADLGAIKITKMIDDLMGMYVPEQKTRPLVEVVSDATFLAKTVWRKRDGLPPILTVIVNTNVLEKDSILRQVLAHEVIHVHLYAKYGTDVAKHGEHFNLLADKINSIEGKNYVSQYADDTNFRVKADTSKLLNWSDEYTGEDVGDALDHINLMRNRNMQKGFEDIYYVEDKKNVDPKTLLPAIAFKGKEKGWLKTFPKEEWVSEFKKVHDRDISLILEASDYDGINLPIVVDGELGDGYARVILAYALGETVPVAMFTGDSEYTEID
jgi:8-oxo-dGTP pyrophosphatase MutT (NUDIX family)